MKAIFILILGLIGFTISGQTFKCGTMEVLTEKIKIDPSLKNKMDVIEKQTQDWLKNNPQSRIKNQTEYSPTVAKLSVQKNNNTFSVASLCGYDNTFFTAINAPTVLNQSVSPSPNCTYGGEYVRINNLIAGRIYRISTCGLNTFDTQLTIYTAGGSQAVAHNDDWCNSQSEILFNPQISGNYDILIDEYDCLSNSLCSSLEVELWYVPRPVITIPVVVHVIHYGESIGTGRNISSAQIQSQVNSLNADFRRLNSDINNVPAAFKGVSDDALLQFCLAQQDEFGNPTTGIKRYIASNPQVTKNDMETSIKPATIWDRDKYLNLWTVDFAASENGLVGYAQFPGGAATTDGVVLRYNAFGTVGNVISPYHLGRPTTHEVGHWLNLHHVWGNDGGACTGDDFISDTPNQSDMQFGCPIFPLTDACSPNYPGVMFMNFMDYTDDACKQMFTVGQASRIDATLYGTRISLQSSSGCLPSTVNINENDFNETISIYPNPTSGMFNIKLNSLYQNYSTISIINAVGQKIISIPNADSLTIIDLSTQPNGIYLIQINSNTEAFNKKIILNK